jgi:hypothetical protein
MDCEKFDQHVIDALYDELDELTHAALKRHVEGCSRCAGIYAGLRATREVGILPMVEAPDDLEARILDAVTVAQRSTPWHKKVLRGLAWAGSHAMRPQLAMAALFFLVIGSSLLLLRARPGTLGPVRVTESGAPTPEVAAAAAPAATAMAAATASPADPAAAEGAIDGAYASAAPQKADDRLAERSKAGKAEQQEGSDGRAALAEARALRNGSGCGVAVVKLDEVAVRFAGTQAASDAMWDEATCYKQLGDRSRAQQLFLSLRSTGYRDRAQQELATEDNSNLMQNQGGGSRAGPAAPAAPAAAPASPKHADADAYADAKPSEASAPSAAAGAGPGNAKAAKRPAAAAPNPKAPAAPARAYGYSP